MTRLTSSRARHGHRATRRRRTATGDDGVKANTGDVVERAAATRGDAGDGDGAEREWVVDARRRGRRVRGGRETVPRRRVIEKLNRREREDVVCVCVGEDRVGVGVVVVTEE